MLVPKLLLTPIKLGFLAQKRPKLVQNMQNMKLAFLSIAGSFGALLVGWLVLVARALSRKTPIYFVIEIIQPINF